jgi:sirohydrochlorin cobaltochelatase
MPLPGLEYQDGARFVLLACALVLDALFGEFGFLFRILPHPVALLGRAIAWFETRLNRPDRSPRARLQRGLLTLAVLTAASACVGYGIAFAAGLLRFGEFLELFLVAVLLAQRSLFDHVRAVAAALAGDGLAAGRTAVTKIVGRDVTGLDKHGVARAAIESLAENFSDAVIAPAFWYLLLGLPGIMAYKCVNTLDSMIGHKSERYRRFGAPAAYADTALNLVPARLPGRVVRHAFLEFSRPTIAEGLDALRAQGLNRVQALPALLFTAGHVKNDIPSVLDEYAARHKGFEIQYGRALGFDPKLLRAAGDRILAAMEAADRRHGAVSRDDTLLLTVGRGASDPDANADMAKLGRMLWEGLGFGWGEVAYSGVTFPLVAPALERVARLGFRRIVVFPYFLFTGVLVGRIAKAAEEARTPAGPQIEIAGYLGDHPSVLDTVLERLEDIEHGDTAMNCALCKYREKVLGFEDEVGLPQAAHHKHVEGGGHTHAHGRHHPYPHADHPLGPRTLVQQKRG